MSNEVTIHVKAKDDASKTMGAVSSGAKKMGVAAGAAALAVGGVLVKAIGDSIAEAQEAVKVHNQTVAVLKSTGNAAKISATGVEKLAESISKKTGIDDEAIQSGENLLLTFTGIRNEVGKGNDIFNQATMTITDMSVALGQDMKSSAIQVGKALNDPIKGMTALSRVGVSFTEQQKEQIKTLVESGDKLGAQKIILKELKKEFGGSAEAAATFADKAKVVSDNIKEEFGKKMLPALEKVSKWFTEEGADAISEFTDSFDAQQMNDAADAVILLAEGLLKVSKVMGKWDKTNGRAFTAFGVNIGLLSDAFVYWKAKATSAMATVATMMARLGLLPNRVAKNFRRMANEANDELNKVINKHREMADKVNKKKVESKIKADIKDLEGKVRNAKKRLQETNDKKTQAKIRAEIGQLQDRVAAAKRALASIRNRSVTIHTFYTSSGQGPNSAGRRASGGLVGSHADGGGPRSNSVLVGEHGPEIVDLAPGSMVHSNPDSQRMMNGRGKGGNITINVNAPNYVGAPSDLLRALVDAKRRGQLDVILR